MNPKFKIELKRTTYDKLVNSGEATNVAHGELTKSDVKKWISEKYPDTTKKHSADIIKQMMEYKKIILKDAKDSKRKK